VPREPGAGLEQFEFRANSDLERRDCAADIAPSFLHRFQRFSHRAAAVRPNVSNSRDLIEELADRDDSLSEGRADLT
jgi:hypothetical protein